MKNIVKTLSFSFVMFFILMLSVNAALPEKLTGIIQVGDTVKDTSGYGMALKVAEDNGLALICTEYDNLSPATRTNACIKTNDWSEQVRYAVGTIIQMTSINTTSMTEDYFAAELAINQFLYNKNLGGRNVTGVLSSTYKSKFDSYLSAANKAYEQYGSKASVSVQISPSKLTFTLNGDYYESNEITATGNFYAVTVSSSVGTPTSTGQNKFKIRVPKSSITATTNVTVTIKGTSANIVQARNYDCESNKNGTYEYELQTVTPNTVETITKSASSSVSGTISLGKLTIKKVDENGKLIAGAQIKIEGPNNYSKTITTGTTEITMDNLALGEYTITEVKAPNGYILSNEEKKVTISNTNLTVTIEIPNEPANLRISKVNLANSKLLEGATLEIQDKDGNVVKYCIDKEGNKNTECRWVSTNEPYEIESFPAGTYYLVEIIAPEGFIKSEEKVEFTIEEGKAPKPVQMKNAPTKVEISKIDSSTGKLLEGAILKIEDEAGNKLYEWTTTDESYEIEGLAQGTYYLIEIDAPEGYDLNEEPVKFVVDGITDVIEVEMKNDKNYDVPNTLSGKSALLIAFGMFDIALGIGILLYFKKNKAMN